MESDLFFMMGQYRAQIPDDRHYSKRHLWLKDLGDGNYRVGFTDYSVRLLQDIYFLEWNIDEGATVTERQEIGEIESSKAVSSMFPPASGLVVKFNGAILNDPAVINSGNYEGGWLYDFMSAGPFLSAAEYVTLLEDGWEQTQRTIKGQMH